jgi:ectoine hydroxylase-related dioxygenase (phytanoyl-CoA dioxygenase family)
MLASARVLAAYQWLGFHLERDVLTPAEYERLRGAARALPSFTSGDPSPANNPHRTHAEFLDALRHPAIVRIAAELVGGPVSGLQTQLLYTPPGTPGFKPHQDNYYIQTTPDALVSAWVALEDATADNGGLFAYPGSHREPILPVDEVPGAVPHATQTFNGIRLCARVPARFSRVDLDVPAGWALFIHGHLLHGSHDNASTRPRMALLMSYVRTGEPFRAGERGQRTAVEVGPQGWAPSAR